MNAQQGFAIWLTGLPASGKSSITRELEKMLKAHGIHTVVLESDEMRKIQGQKTAAVRRLLPEAPCDWKQIVQPLEPFLQPEEIVELRVRQETPEEHP